MIRLLINSNTIEMTCEMTTTNRSSMYVTGFMSTAFQKWVSKKYFQFRFCKTLSILTENEYINISSKPPSVT